MRRRYGGWAYLLPAALLALVTVDHAVYNAAAVAEVTAPADRRVSLPAALVEGYGWLGSGHGTRWLLLALLVAAVVADHRAAARVDPLVPPLPGGPVGTRLRAAGWRTARRLHGRPGSQPAVVRSTRRAGAAAVWAATDAASRAGHELLLLLAAARGGPQLLFPAATFIRQRRELAHAILRAGGRPRRDLPSRRQVWLTGAGLAGALLVTAAAQPLVLGWLDLPAAGDPAFFAGLFQLFAEWWSGLSAGQQIALVVALAALLSLLGMGFFPALTLAGAAATLAEYGRGVATFITNPGRATRDFLTHLTPGEAAAYLLALLLQRAVPASVGSTLAHAARDRVAAGTNAALRSLMDESARLFSTRERRIAEVFIWEGKHVKALPENVGQRVKTPDALVDGVPTEFKSLDPGATNGTVRGRLGDAKSQARATILDGRSTGLTEAEARKGLARFLGAHPDRLDSIRILGDGFDIRWP